MIEEGGGWVEGVKRGGGWIEGVRKGVRGGEVS